MASNHKLMLSDKELVNLCRLVGGHTVGGDKSLGRVYDKLYTLYAHHTGGLKAYNLPNGIYADIGHSGIIRLDNWEYSGVSQLNELE